jgi:hypothetical protein
MAKKKALEALTARFRAAGAPDAEAWARSQLDEGIDQLSRFLFLRQAWGAVIRDGATEWIDAMIAQARKDPGGPGSAIGPALERTLGAGAAPADLAEIVRTMQWELLFSLCYLLEDPGLSEPDLAGVSWGLFSLDADGEPVARIGGLHESVLETDPTGREMRPRS